MGSKASHRALRGASPCTMARRRWALGRGEGVLPLGKKTKLRAPGESVGRGVDADCDELQQQLRADPTVNGPRAGSSGADRVLGASRPFEFQLHLPSRAVELEHLARGKLPKYGREDDDELGGLECLGVARASASRFGSPARSFGLLLREPQPAEPPGDHLVLVHVHERADWRTTASRARAWPEQTHDVDALSFLS